MQGHSLACLPRSRTVEIVPSAQCMYVGIGLLSAWMHRSIFDKGLRYSDCKMGCRSLVGRKDAAVALHGSIEISNVFSGFFRLRSKMSIENRTTNHKRRGRIRVYEYMVC